MILYAANIDPIDMEDQHAEPIVLNITQNSGMSDMKSFMEFFGDPDIDYPGIVTPTLYVGTEGSLFQCHIEDVSLQGINMHISGGPKIWYVRSTKCDGL